MVTASLLSPQGKGTGETLLFGFKKYLRRVRLTCSVTPLLSLSSDHACDDSVDAFVLFVHTAMQSAACDKLYNCNLPNESSRSLN